MKTNPDIIQNQAADYIATVIKQHLEADKSVLWLVPGGSSIQVALMVDQLLKHIDLSRLNVTLTDERYGPIGHSDSNWKQLQDGGFRLSGATKIPVLRGVSMDETIHKYGEVIRSTIAAVDYSIGFFGIGPDGHTAGILPGSPAESAQTSIYGYQAEKFTRITITKSIIASLDEAVVYAVGENKWPIIEALSGTMERADWPAMSLKKAGKLTLFTDYPGDAK